MPHAKRARVLITARMAEPMTKPDAAEIFRTCDAASAKAMGQRLGSPIVAKAKLMLDLEREGDDYVIVGAEVVITPDAPHNPETCRDPACDCMPF